MPFVRRAPVVAAFMLCSTEVFAADADVEAQPEPPQDQWAIAAGIGLTGLATGLGAGQGSLSDPTLSLMLERRLARPLWLLARLTGGYSSSEQSGSAVPGGLPPLAGDSQRIGGALGVRFVFTPDDPFRVSTFTTGGVLHERTSLEPVEPVEGAPDGGYRSERTAFSAQAGIAVDRELITRLGLRLSTVIAYAGWSTSSEEANLGPAGESEMESEGFSAGVTLSPAIELRFSF